MAERIDQRMHSVNGVRVPQSILIPSRNLVEGKIVAVPPGTAASLAGIRTAMAAETGADACCPVTTQRHLRAIAEDVASGHSEVPYWRVVDPGAPATRRLGAGAEFVRKKRQAERSRAK